MLKIMIDGGQSFKIQVADHIKKGETISLNYEYRFKNYIHIEVWDLDEGTRYDPHDFINKVRITSYDEPGDWTYTLRCRNTEYKLSYFLETRFSKPSDKPEEYVGPHELREKILKHFAGQPEISPSIWRCYGRDQVALELKARLFRKSMSDAEINRLKSYPFSWSAYYFPFPVQWGTELCGPAAIAYDLFLADPTTYLSSIVALFDVGECPVGGLYLRPSKRIKQSYREKITAIDWMLLASMRAERNKYFRVDDESSWPAFFTTPADMLSWLRRIYPYECVYQRLRVTRKDSQQAHRRAIAEALRKRTRSFFLIDAKLIKPRAGSNRISRLHWIVIKPGSAVWSKDGKEVKVTFFTWGSEWTKTFTINRLIRYLYVTIVRD